METKVDRVRLGEQPRPADCSTQDILLLLRAEIQQGFSQLSVKLVEEIKVAQSKDTSPLTAGSFFPQKLNFIQKSTNEQELKKSKGNSVVKEGDNPHVLKHGKSWKTATEGEVEKVTHNWRDAISGQVESHSILAHTFHGIAAEIKHTRTKLELSKKYKLYRLVHSSFFTNLCSLVILTNAIWMGYEADNRTATETGWQDSVGKTFSIWFIFELCFKMVALGRGFVCGPDSQWNFVDTLCVLSSIPDFFSTSVNMSFIRMVRLAKLTRGLRLVRLLKFLKSLREILMTVIYTMGSLFWSFISILFVSYLFALIFLQVLGMHVEDGDQFSHETMENFADVVSSMKSLFTMVSGGQDWYGFAQDFHAHGAYLAEAVLFFWIFFMLFGLVNVVIAVFCAQTEEVNQARSDLRIQKDKENQAKNFAEWIQIFHMIDTESTGFVSWSQFHAFANSNDGEHLLQSHGLSHFALLDVWSIMDSYTGTDGKVDMTGFVMGFMRLSKDFQSSNLLLLSATLHALSKDSRTTIRELKEDLTIIRQFLQVQLEIQGRGSARVSDFSL